MLLTAVPEQMIVAQLIKKFTAFLESGILLPCLDKQGNGTYPEPAAQLASRSSAFLSTFAMYYRCERAHSMCVRLDSYVNKMKAYFTSGPTP